MTFSPPDWQHRFGWSAAAAEVFNAALAALPDPGALADAAASFLGRASDVEGAGRYFDDADAPVALARLCYAAPFLLGHLSRHPRALEVGVLTDLRSGGGLLPWPGDPLPASAPLLPQAEQMRLMRRWKYDNYVRLTARFLLGAADAEATCRIISDLADGLIRTAYTHAFGTLAVRLGIPLCKAGQPAGGSVLAAGTVLAGGAVLAGGTVLAGGAVLAMGKLGGRELNYASDVDLIFVQEGDHTPCRMVNGLRPPPAALDADAGWWEAWERMAQEAAGAAGGGGAPGETTSGEFHQRLARQTSKLLSEPMAEGFGFRVDLDLRPQGREGLLAPTVAAMEIYYTGQGREWERMAMIKARQVIGAAGIAGRIQEIVRPFVYRRYLDYSALEGVAIVKHDINRVHATSLERNIKLGRGGIRENEFLVQALQLLHGGKRPEVQATGHQQALERLEAAGILDAEERSAIEADYWRLRGVENRLQMVGEQQTHDLPQPGPELTRVLHDFLPGFDRRESEARAALEAARNRTEARFRRFFAGLGGDRYPEPEAWRKAVAGLAGPEVREEALRRIDAVFERLMRTRAGERCVFKLARLVEQEPLYLRGTEAALPRWLDFIEQIGNRNAIYTLIETHPPIVPWVSQIFREGGRHASLLIRHPEFLESFFALNDSWDNLAADFEDIANGAPDEESFILELQNTKARGLIRVLTSYLGHEDDGRGDGGRGDDGRGDDSHRLLLDALAEATVRACTRFAWRLTCQRMGAPAGGNEAEVSGFAVLALGKLGSGGMRFGSDLDLVFVHGGEGETAKGRAHSEFYTRLAQKIGTLLTAPTQFGRLYELDHRLRPFGGKGLLVPSLAAYRNFLGTGPGSAAEVWNFQAFTRIRPIAGEAALGDRLILEIAAAWRERKVPPREIARQAWDMLKRLLAEQNKAENRAGNRAGIRAGRASEPERDALPLKYAVGGLLGYEFLSQAHFLRVRSEGGEQGADWTPPPPHETMKAWENGFRTIGALDERLSFYEPDGQHLLRPDRFNNLAAVARRWNLEEVRALCSRMEEAIVEAFRVWGA